MVQNVRYGPDPTALPPGHGRRPGQRPSRVSDGTQTFATARDETLETQLDCELGKRRYADGDGRDEAREERGKCRRICRHEGWRTEGSCAAEGEGDGNAVNDA